MNDDKRDTWTILGREIGTATGWDQADTFAMIVYEFEGNEIWKRCNLPEGDLMFDFDRGVIEKYEEDGTVIYSADLVNAFKNLETFDQ